MSRHRDRDPQRPKLLGSARRKARWVARQASRKVALSREQLDLIRRTWGPTPDDEDVRRLRRDRRGLVPEFFAKGVLYLLLGLFFLIVVSLWAKSHGL